MGLSLLAVREEKTSVIMENSLPGWLGLGAAGPVPERVLTTVAGRARFCVILAIVAVTIDSLDLMFLF